jgi:hypothetical protein
MAGTRAVSGKDLTGKIPGAVEAGGPGREEVLGEGGLLKQAAGFWKPERAFGAREKLQVQGQQRGQPELKRLSDRRRDGRCDRAAQPGRRTKAMRWCIWTRRLSTPAGREKGRVKSLYAAVGVNFEGKKDGLGRGLKTMCVYFSGWKSNSDRIHWKHGRGQLL